MYIPIPMISRRVNPDFLRALNEKAVPEEHVRGYRREYGEKRQTFGRITMGYWIAYAVVFLLLMIFPGPGTAILFFLVTFLGVVVMYPIITSWISHKEILSAIERNYPGI